MMSIIQAGLAARLLAQSDGVEIAVVVYYSLLVASALFAMKASRDFTQGLSLWAQKKVQQEAARVDPHLRVSSDLLLSFPELQDEFYKWMDKAPAVRWHPRLVLAMELAYSLKLLHKDGCGWLQVLMFLPCQILAGVRVALEGRSCSKQAQSMASVLCTAIMASSTSVLMIRGDPCMVSMGPSLASPAMAAAFAACTLIVNHLTSACTMRHLPLVCWITGLGNITAIYTKYLQQNGGLSFQSDPFFRGLFAITMSTLGTLVVATSLRLLLVMTLMIPFLKSVRPPRRD